MDNRDEIIEIKENLIEDRSLIETCISNIMHDVEKDKVDKTALLKELDNLKLYTKLLNLRINELNELSKPTHDDKVVIMDYLERRFKKREAEGYRKSLGDTPCILCTKYWSHDITIKRHCDECKKTNYSLWVVDVRNPDFLKVSNEFHKKLNKTYGEIDAIDIMIKTMKEFRETYGDYLSADFYDIMNGGYERRKKQIIEERKNLYKEYCDD